jgi:hypothetical protein
LSQLKNDEHLLIGKLHYKKKLNSAIHKSASRKHTQMQAQEISADHIKERTYRFKIHQILKESITTH